MSRPSKNTVDFFYHPCKHGKKMSYIEKKYGNDGYAVWFKLLEELGDADDHYLDLSDDVQVMFLTDRLGVDEDLLLDIIKDLIRLGQFDKQLWQDYQVLYNQIFVDSISHVYKKRNTQIINLKVLRKRFQGFRNDKKVSATIIDSLQDVDEVIVSENPQSIVEYSREEDSIVEYSKPKNYHFSDSVEYLFLDVLRDFPEALHPNTPAKVKKWKDTLRLLLEKDKIPSHHVKELVFKARNDEFWSKQFLSIVKLRRNNPDGVKYIQVFYERFKNTTETYKQQTSGFREKLKRGLSGNSN